MPGRLGVKEGIPASETIIRLELAIEKNYGSYVKERVMSKHGELLDFEFEWELLELKRYFLMTTVLKNVPMFSVHVDEIWHEMILHTRAYQAFCTEFTGRFLHHSPHLQTWPDWNG